jgi:predicted dehydrogenase
MNTFRVGLVGCGLNSENHLMAFSNIKGIRPVAVCDTNLTRAKEKASRYGVKQVFTDFNSMLKLDLDLVDIVTPTPTQKSGRTLCVAHNKLFFDSVSQTKKTIEDERLSASRMRVSKYSRHARDSSDSWRTDEKYGGVLWEALVHHIYLIEYFLGDSQSVYAVANKVEEQFSNSFTLVLENDRKVGVVEYEWNTKEPFFEIQLLTEEGDRFHSNLTHDFMLRRSRKYKNREMEALRSFKDDLYIPTVKWSGHLLNLLKSRSYPRALPLNRSFQRLITQLLSFIYGSNNTLPVTAEHGLRTVRVLEAVKKSIITGKNQSLE